jgi:excisionase family DNA binding protein
MTTEKVNDVNDFILSRDNRHEAEFYTEICDYFEYKKLDTIFQLNMVIEIFYRCIQILSTSEHDHKQKVIFIKNILSEYYLNDIQKYNFFLLFHIFIDNLLYEENILNGVDYFINFFEDQLDSLNENATLYYYDFNIATIMSEISHLSNQEQIDILRTRKKNYLVKVSSQNIPKNNFDKYCDEQIEGLKDQIYIQSDISSPNFTKKAEEEIGSNSSAEVEETEYTRPKLTLPEILKNNEFGNVNYAAEFTGYSVHHIRYLARKRKIPCYKPSKTGQWRFHRNDLEDWMKNGMKNFQTEDDSLLRRKK